MKTYGILIKRSVKAINEKGEVIIDENGKPVMKKKFFRCRVNAAVPRSHRMVQCEYEM